MKRWEKSGLEALRLCQQMFWCKDKAPCPATNPAWPCSHRGAVRLCGPGQWHAQVLLAYRKSPGTVTISNIPGVRAALINGEQRVGRSGFPSINLISLTQHELNPCICQFGKAAEIVADLTEFCRDRASQMAKAVFISWEEGIPSLPDTDAFCDASGRLHGWHKRSQAHGGGRGTYSVHGT